MRTSPVVLPQSPRRQEAPAGLLLATGLVLAVAGWVSLPWSLWLLPVGPFVSVSLICGASVMLTQGFGARHSLAWRGSWAVLTVNAIGLVLLLLYNGA